MAVYAWQGIDSKGKTAQGVRDAESPRALRSTLRREGVLVTEVLEESAARERKSRDVDFKRYFKRLNTQHIAMMTRQLATLLRSGVPLVEALDALIEQSEHESMTNAITQTRDKVNEGTSLADALQAHPKIFSNLYVHMVSAGEASGTLDGVLEKLAEFLEAQARLKSKVTSALTYPLFMAILAVAVIAILMTVVVPQVTTIFEDYDEALPWYTRLLIFSSNVLTDYWWLVIGLIVGAVFWFRKWKSTEEGRAQWDRLILKAPLIGPLILMAAVARFASTLATLLSSGVPLLRAMEITRNVLGNVELMQVVDDARNAVREGESIAAPLKRSDKFPPIVTHMIAVGERSGQLEEMLEHVAHAYDMQVDTRVAAMTSLLEPMMIVVMGGVSAGITFSILMPLMKINEFVQ